MRKITTILTFIFMAVTAFLAVLGGWTRNYAVPPDGHLYALHAGSTLYGIQNAMLGKPGANIFMKEGEDAIVFGWAIKDAGVGAFTCVRASGVTCLNDLARILGGNVANAKDYSDLVRYMKDQGWKIVTAAEIPQALRVALSASTSALMQAVANETVFLIVPGVLLDDSALAPYKEWRE